MINLLLLLLLLLILLLLPVLTMILSLFLVTGSVTRSPTRVRMPLSLLIVNRVRTEAGAELVISYCILPCEPEGKQLTLYNRAKDMCVRLPKLLTWVNINRVCQINYN